jgi:hypothetical protein
MVRRRLLLRDVQKNCRGLSLCASLELREKASVFRTTSRAQLRLTVEGEKLLLRRIPDTFALSLYFADPKCLLAATEALVLVDAVRIICTGLCTIRMLSMNMFVEVYSLWREC